MQLQLDARRLGIITSHIRWVDNEAESDRSVDKIVACVGGGVAIAASQERRYIAENRYGEGVRGILKSTFRYDKCVCVYVCVHAVCVYMCVCMCACVYACVYSLRLDSAHQGYSLTTSTKC